MATNPSLLGRLVAGRYRLQQRRGAGGHGIVLDAFDEQLERPVALKILRPQFGATAGSEPRFRLEAQIAASMSHPNLNAVYDWGVEEIEGARVPYLVLEHLPGGSLRDMIDRGRLLTPSQALIVGLDVCRGLDYMHRHGVMHRDLKPANLAFGEDRHVRILDVGLSRFVAEQTWVEPTAAGLEAAQYASPEQARGGRVDDGTLTDATDIYALALVLIEAVTGQVPFSSDSTVATLNARLDKLMPVSADFGPLASVLSRAGSAVPGDRYSASEFGRALVQAAEKLPRPAPLPIVGAGPVNEALFAETPAKDPTWPIARPTLPPTDGAPPPAVVADIAPTTVVPDVTEPPAAPTITPASATPSVPVLPGTPGRPAVPPPPPLMAQAGETPPTVPSGWGTMPPPTGGATTFSPTDARPIDTPPIVLPGAPAPVDAPRALDASITDVAPASIGPSSVVTASSDVPIVVAPPVQIDFPVDDLVGGGSHGGGGDGAADDAAPVDDDWQPGRRRRVGWLIGVLVAVVALAVGAFVVYGLVKEDTHTVPELAGLSQAVAENQIAENGWNIVIARERSDEQPADNVIRTDPVAGTKLDEGASITFVVSDGATLAVLPDIAGQTLDAATALLTTSRLTISVAGEQYDEVAPAGTIISWTVPEQPGLAAGAQVMQNTAISAIVSKGPVPRVVPTLVGLDIVAATAALTDMQLVVVQDADTFSHDVPVGIIAAQSVPPGTEVGRGETVIVAVSKGQDLVTVPSLGGLTYAQIEAALAAVGLTVGDVDGDRDAGMISDARVGGVALVPGQQLERGTPIDLIFVTPPPPRDHASGDDTGDDTGDDGRAERRHHPVLGWLTGTRTL